MSIIYVNDKATGSNNGSSWDNAYTRLQDALNSATPGDEVWVADGTYKPTAVTDRTASFVIPNEVKVYGGFAGGESNRSDRNVQRNKTILSGDIGTTDDNSDNTHQVVSLNNVTSDTVLDGFTITDGNADDRNQNAGGGIVVIDSTPVLANLIILENSGTFGGGIYSRNSQYQLSNVEFLNNVAFTDGGGIYTDGSINSLDNVTFENNGASRYGGGIYTTSTTLNLTDAKFIGNSTGADGGGIYNNRSIIDLTDIEFIANRAGNRGGGIYNGDSGKFVLEDGIFLNNRAVTQGGGIYNVRSRSDDGFTISDSIFKENVADVGGGIYNNRTFDVNNTITNSLFEDNYTRVGGGIFNEFSSPRIINSTFAKNLSLFGAAVGTQGNSGNQIQPSIINSIFWDNLSIFGRDPISDFESVTGVTFSLVEGGFPGNNNIDADPQFVDPDNFDYRLSTGSPALNTGINDVVNRDDDIDDFDLAGNPRIADNRIDIGPYEGAELAPIPTDPKILETSTIIYVDRDATGDNNGNSWANAYTNLQNALTNAPLGSEIWVAQGTYIPSLDEREVSFQLRNTIAIYGGFVGNETSREQRNIEINRTILSGAIGQGGDIADNSYHVVNASNVTTSAVLDGFTIRGGNADNSRNNNNRGGGIYSSSSQATLQNLRIDNNNAQFGGGIYIEDDSSHLLTNVTFANNSSTGSGGAVYNEGNSFFFDSEFINNTSGGSGGAIYNQRSSIYIEGATFDSNRATNAGGAIFFDDNSFGTSERVINSVFNNNDSSAGGAIYNNFSDAEGINLTFANNEAENGAAVYSQGRDDDINPEYYNSIFWDNQGTVDTAQIFNNGENTIVSNSIVQGGFSGQNNLDADPQFIDQEAGDLRISSGSPAIDSGLNDVVIEDEDIAGLSRIINNTVDMGAYEYIDQVLSISSPVISLENVQGDSEDAVFTVSLLDSNGNSPNNDTPVTVDYTTVDGTAKAGEDYTAASGTLTFAPGETEKTITVPVKRDAIEETNKTFSVELSNASIEAVSKSQGVGTITNNEDSIVDPVINPLDTTINRFQNRDVSGTFLFADENESVNIREQFPNFIEEGEAFKVAKEEADGLIRLNRFQNRDVPGTFLFADENESINIRENFPNFIEEGIAFYVYDADANQGIDYYRFQNKNIAGTYIFVDETERDNILANFPNDFELEGVAFEVGEV